MTRSYLEMLFRHRRLVLAPVVIAFLLGTGLALVSPRKYQAQASLWADSSITAASTIGTSGSADGQDPPSTGQQALFAELVGTRGFLLEVAQASPLAKTFTGISDQQVDRKLTALRATIKSETAGPHILNISVSRPSAAQAEQLDTVLVAHFLTDQEDLLRRRAQTEITYLKQQLDAAQADVVAASKTGIQSGALADAVLQTAQQQRLEAQQNYEKAKAATAAIGNEGVLYVRDKPDNAVRLSRLKTLVLGAFGGLLAGLTIGLITLVVLMARQRSATTDSELEALLGLPVIGTIDDFGRSRPLGAHGASGDAGTDLSRT